MRFTVSEVFASVKLPARFICLVIRFPPVFWSRCVNRVHVCLDEESSTLGVRILPCRAEVPLRPRKSPVQSIASVDAILDATIHSIEQHICQKRSMSGIQKCED